MAASKISFLIKGLLDWMADANLTPYLVINANLDGVQVPRAFAQPDGSITLNLSGHAIRHLEIAADGLGFDSRFQGQPHSIWVPINAILGLVSRETSDGLWFPENQPSSSVQKGLGEAPNLDDASVGDLKGANKGSGQKEKARGRPNLTIVE